MAVKQLTVYVENQTGSLLEITEILAESGIDLKALSVADTENFGIIKIISTDTERAAAVLKASGYTAKSRDVIAFSIPNKPGGLRTVLKILADNSIDMEYMYSLVSGKDDMAKVVIRVNDNDKAENILKNNGVMLLSQGDL